MDLHHALAGFAGVGCNTHRWAWEDRQLLGALAAPAEDLGFASSTHTVAHKHP